MKKHSVSRFLHRQVGFVMLELLVALVVIMMIVLFVIGLASEGTSKVKGMQSGTLHTLLVKNALTAYDPQNNCNGISPNTLASLDAVPDAMEQGGLIVDTWGGQVNVASSTTLVTDDTMVITYPAVPAEDCGNFTTAIEGEHFRVVVNGVTVKDITANQQFSVTALANACSGAGNKAISVYSRCR